MSRRLRLLVRRHGGKSHGENRRQSCHRAAGSDSDAPGREITDADIPPEDWERELKKLGLYLTKHLLTMAELNRPGRYERMADGVERVAGR